MVGSEDEYLTLSPTFFSFDRSPIKNRAYGSKQEFIVSITKTNFTFILSIYLTWEHKQKRINYLFRE